MDPKEMTEAHYEAQCKRFVVYSFAYYETATSLIDDAEYDRFAKGLLEHYDHLPQWFRDLYTHEDLRAGTSYHLRSKWPEWVRDAASNINVTMNEPFEAAKHLSRMYSLRNGFDEADIDEFIVNSGTAEGDVLKLYMDVKADGMAINATYYFGTLRSLVTRGDGDTGDDITHMAKYITGVLLKLPGENHPAWLEVRGELTIRHEDFDAYNEWAIKEGRKPLVNPRNGVAGTMRLKDVNEIARRRVHFYVHGIGKLPAEWSSLTSHTEVMDKLVELGFVRVTKVPIGKGMSFIATLTSTDARARISEVVPYAIDGVVLKYDDMALQERVGFLERSPKWGLAYKFPAESAMTEISDIRLQVGRTGVITPVAEVKTVFVGGVNVSKATLHNEQAIVDWDFRVGDRVLIRRAGDVIPEIYNNMDMLSPHRITKKRWSMPRQCPSCGSELEREDDKKKIYCKNSYACPAQLLAMCTHMVSRDAYDIEGLAEGTLAKLIEAGLIEFPYQVLLLDEDWIAQVTGKLVASKVIAAMGRSCAALPLRKFVYALGIPLVGQTTARDLANTYGTIDKIMEATVESLITIDGIEETTALRISDAFRDGGVKSEVDNRRARTTIINPAKIEHQPLRGETIVITGSFGDVDRSEVTELLLSMGAKVSGSVSAKTTKVFAGDNAGSKLAKAEKLNIPVLDKDQVLEFIHKEKQAP